MEAPYGVKMRDTFRGKKFWKTLTDEGRSYKATRLEENDNFI